MSSRPTIDTTVLDELGRFFVGKCRECGGVLGGTDYERISVWSPDANAYCDRNEYRPDTEPKRKTVIPPFSWAVATLRPRIFLNR